MKRTNLHPGKYHTQLNELVSNLTKKNLCAIKIYLSYVQIIWESTALDTIAQELMEMLYCVAMEENPVYRHSPKLRDIALGLINSDLHKQEQEKLKQFIKSNKDFNIEGYVIFRMEEHHKKLDMMLYSIMKKINSTKY